MAYFIISIRKDSYVLTEADCIETALSDVRIAAETANSSDCLSDPAHCEWIKVEARHGIARRIFGENRIVDDTAHWTARREAQSASEAAANSRVPVAKSIVLAGMGAPPHEA